MKTNLIDDAENSNFSTSKGSTQFDVSSISLAQLLQHDDRKFWSRTTLSTLGLLGILFGIFLIFSVFQMGETECSYSQATCPVSTKCPCTKEEYSYAPVVLTSIFPLIGFFSILASAYRTKILAVVCAVLCVLGYVIGFFALVVITIVMNRTALSDRYADTPLALFYAVLIALTALNLMITMLTSTFLFRACCYCKIRAIGPSIKLRTNYG